MIRKQIEALDSDLVVIGKHGKSGLEDLLLGSVMKQVMQYADWRRAGGGVGRQIVRKVSHYLFGGK